MAFATDDQTRGAVRLSVDSLVGLPHEQVVSDLEAIRGIGDLDVVLVCVRALAGADIVSTGGPRLLDATTLPYGRSTQRAPGELAYLTSGWTSHRARDIGSRRAPVRWNGRRSVRRCRPDVLSSCWARAPWPPGWIRISRGGQAAKE